MDPALFKPYDPTVSWADIVDEVEGESAEGIKCPPPSPNGNEVPSSMEDTVRDGAEKARICFLNLKYGRCFHGENCKYTHKREPLNVCKHWSVKKADCPYGEKCNRDHGKVTLEMPVNKFPSWCLKAAEQGAQKCMHGRKCYYLHPEDLQPIFTPQ